MIVELVYDRDCPNVPETRASLIKAFALTGIPARWREWDRCGTEAPEYARRYGSPTILVNGADVTGIAPQEDIASCRVYPDAVGKLNCTPPIDAICSALTSAAAGQPQSKPVHGVAAASAAVGVALMPKLVCPLCFPAYAALLSTIGLEFFDYTPYLLALTAVFLSIALLILAAQARRSGRWTYLAFGVMAGTVILAGKFYWEGVWLTVAGLAMLVVAIVLSGRAIRALGTRCPSCTMREHNIGLIKEQHHV